MKILGQQYFAIRADKIIYIRKTDKMGIYMILEGACLPLTLDYESEEGRDSNYQLIINAMKEEWDEQNKDKR